MAVAKSTTVVGVFANRPDADRGIDELLSAGFHSNDIGVMTRNEEGVTPRAAPHEGESMAEEGAVAGAVAGAGIGGLVGLGVLSGVIPAIGPALAAGTLATILSNAAGGAAIAGLAGALAGWGVPEEEAQYYENEMKQGRIVVTVHADEQNDEEARIILHRNGGYDQLTAPPVRSSRS